MLGCCLNGEISMLLKIQDLGSTGKHNPRKSFAKSQNMENKFLR